MSAFAHQTGTELPAIEPRGAVDTVRQGFAWFVAHPGLGVAFLAYGLLSGYAGLASVDPLPTIVAAVAGLLCVLVGAAATHWVGAAELSHEPASVVDGLRVGVRRIVSLVAIYVPTVLAVAIGLVLLVLPGLYIAARLSLAPVACVLEGDGAADAIAASWTVTKGHVLHVLAVLGIGVIAGFLVLLPAELLLGSELSGLTVGPVTAAVLGPTMQLALARVYVSLRGQVA